MGGTLGTLAGALFALIFFGFLFITSRKEIQKEMSGDDEITEDDPVIFKAIILTVIPVIISQSIYTLGYTIDDFLNESKDLITDKYNKVFSYETLSNKYIEEYSDKLPIIFTFHLLIIIIFIHKIF